MLIAIFFHYILKMNMKTSDGFCHSGSVENYFNSPKMPVRDHIEGLRSTQTSFKKQEPLVDQATKKVLGSYSMGLEHVGQVQKMKQMKLMDPKELSIVKHKSGKENNHVGSHHDRQTNPGYSRNKLGGFFTS